MSAPTIQEYLRSAASAFKSPRLAEAADALDARDAEIERLREALREIADVMRPPWDSPRDNAVCARASAALSLPLTDEVPPVKGVGI